MCLSACVVPQDDDKRMLSEEAGLDATQVNNCACALPDRTSGQRMSSGLQILTRAVRRMHVAHPINTGFINQRKRHWLKVSAIGCDCAHS